MQDCEWKLRSTEQTCKAKLVAAETAKRDALDKAAAIEDESKRQMQEVRLRTRMCSIGWLVSRLVNNVSDA